MSKTKQAFVIISGLLVILLLICALRIPLDIRGNTYTEQEDFLSGWSEQDSSRDVSLFHVFGTETGVRTFTRELDGSSLNGRSLCMITHNICFSVKLGGEVLYEFKPKLGGAYGKRYGEAIHTVTIPSFDDTRTLSIEAYSLRGDGTSGCNEAWLSDSRTFVSNIKEKTGLKLAFCIITFFFGVLLFTIGIIEDSMSGNMIEGICLGAITMIVSTWIGSQTMIMRFLSPNPTLLRVIEYIALDVLPIPVMTFVGAFTGNLKNKGVFAITLMSTLNTVCSIILVPLGVIDYSDLLIVTHACIALGVCVIIFLIARSVKKKEMSRQKKISIITAMSALIIGGVADMALYYIKKTPTSTLTVLGMLVFSVILAEYEYKRIINMQVAATKTEIMQTLAMEDTLTKLGSRAAFVALEKEIAAQSEGRCMFVHFDVNNLKRVNDVYGHAEGDRHLIAAADALTKAFGDIGKIFRVGGDEFFAVLSGDADAADYQIGINKLTEAEKNYNSSQKPPVDLEIAYGMAEYDYSEQNPETAERLADSRMYEKKHLMKAKNN